MRTTALRVDGEGLRALITLPPLPAHSVATFLVPATAAEPGKHALHLSASYKKVSGEAFEEKEKDVGVVFHQPFAATAQMNALGNRVCVQVWPPMARRRGDARGVARLTRRITVARQCVTECTSPVPLKTTGYSLDVVTSPQARPLSEGACSPCSMVP